MPGAFSSIAATVHWLNRYDKRSRSVGQLPFSPFQAGELLQACVVLSACLLAFEPLQVALDPRVMTLDRKPRETLRRNEVCQLLLGPLPKHTRLPVLSLLVAVLPVGQLPQLSSGFGIGDDLQRSLERLPGSIG